MMKGEQRTGGEGDVLIKEGSHYVGKEVSGVFVTTLVVVSFNNLSHNMKQTQPDELPPNVKRHSKKCVASRDLSSIKL